MVDFHATTIVAVRRSENDVCIGGDGQVTMGETAVMKHTAKKVRKIYRNTVLTGFAGSVSDAFTLTERFEKKLEEHAGNLKRAAVALAQSWRSDQAIRNLEALMIAVDEESLLVISGNGEVIEPDQDFVAIGSGGNYAYAAANALFNHTDMDAESIVKESLLVASSICVYTNSNISVEKLEKPKEVETQTKEQTPAQTPAEIEAPVIIDAPVSSAPEEPPITLAVPIDLDITNNSSNNGGENNE